MTSWTGKNWIDESDHAGPPASPPGTPFSGAAMEDVETRVTDWAVSVDPFVNVVEEYGAVGDATWTGSTYTGTDNTTAIQNALDDLMARTPQHGGVLYFPASPDGAYLCAGTLDGNSSAGITLLGEGGNTGDLGLNAMPPSDIVYTGGGTASFISARNSVGFTIENLSIRYTAQPTPFQGVLIDVSNQGGGDTQFFTARRSMFGGLGATWASLPNATAISLWNAIFCHVEKCHFGNLEYGIRGAEEVGESLGYSNVVTIRDSSFLRVRYCIVNPGERWTVDSCAFEGLQGGSLANTYIVNALTVDLDTTEGGVGATYTNNWHGDAFGEQVWISSGRHGAGGMISGNQFTGGVGSMDLNTQGASPTGSSGPLTFMSNTCGNEQAASVGVSTQVAGGGGTDEVQVVSVFATSGNYTLTFDGQTTSNIAASASAATVQSALEGLSNIAPGDVAVTDRFSRGFSQYVVTFGGAYDGINVAEMTGTSVSLAMQNFSIDLGDAADRQLAGGLIAANSFSNGTGEIPVIAGTAEVHDHYRMSVFSNYLSDGNLYDYVAPVLNGGATMRVQDPAGTLTVARHTQTMYITAGATTVTTLNGGADGQVVTLICNGQTFDSEAGNLYLDGDFTSTTYGDTLTLAYQDSTNRWWEVSRTDRS